MKRPAFYILLSLLALVILFESAQQLFYLRRYDLAADVHFLDIVQLQTIRWLIWALLGVPLFYFVRKINAGEASYWSRFFRYSLLISGLVITAIILVAIYEYDWSEGYQSEFFFGEFVTFFLFQKTPFFTLGYIALIWVLSLYWENERLQVQVKKLADLLAENEDLVHQLPSRPQPNEQLLTVKSGGKYQVVRLQTIEYLEADDYCVNIHLEDGKKYVMRITLKALEEKLPEQFIRIHRKYIVHLKYVTAFDPEEQRLLLQSTSSLAVSKSKLKLVRTYFAGEQIRSAD
ncbi:MAG: LytTR family DNA-binding domain-containing protein [Bacteroidota bacterium]